MDPSAERQKGGDEADQEGHAVDVPIPVVELTREPSEEE